MRIEHVAVWVADLEAMKDFYCRHFRGAASDRYDNAKTGFSSYFLYFDDGARLELMHRFDRAATPARSDRRGLAHLAFSAGTALEVERLTERLAAAGCELLSAPRLTGDGYFESCLLDPEGNQLEITL